VQQTYGTVRQIVRENYIRKLYVLFKLTLIIRNSNFWAVVSKISHRSNVKMHFYQTISFCVSEITFILFRFAVVVVIFFLDTQYFKRIITRSFATAKSTARPSCLVGVLYDISREKIC